MQQQQQHNKNKNNNINNENINIGSVAPKNMKEPSIHTERKRCYSIGLNGSIRIESSIFSHSLGDGKSGEIASACGCFGNIISIQLNWWTTSVDREWHGLRPQQRQPHTTRWKWDCNRCTGFSTNGTLATDTHNEFLPTFNRSNSRNIMQQYLWGSDFKCNIRLLAVSVYDSSNTLSLSVDDSQVSFISSEIVFVCVCV